MIDAIVFDAAEPWLAARTVRALKRQGVDARVAGAGELAAEVARAERPVWLLRAGAWPMSAPAKVLANAAGQAVVALGATEECETWQSVLSQTGGELAKARDAWPRLDSAIAFDPRSFAALVLASEGNVDRAAMSAARVVRAPSLDVGYHRAQRIVLGVTTLHRGGAERVVLDLAAELRALGHEVLLTILDRAARATFAEPPGTIHLRDHARSRAERLDRLAQIAAAWGADAIHVHLFDGDDVHRLCASDVPVVVTIHNSEPGWPARLARVASADNPPLLLACSRGVEQGLRAGGLGARVRTVWNGIALPPKGPPPPWREERADREEEEEIEGLAPTSSRPAAPRSGALLPSPHLPDVAPARRAAARALGVEGDAPERDSRRAAARGAFGVDGDAPVLVAIANHRPQKRLDRLPAILAAVSGGARLVLVGEPVNGDPEAVAIEPRVRAEAAKHGVSERVLFAGSRAEMHDVYAAADAIISTSAFEGLSLVHLEAVAAGVPLVTTRVAGTDELAAKHAAVHVVPLDADAATFAAALRGALFLPVAADAGAAAADGALSASVDVDAGETALPAARGLAPDFTARAMAARHVELYARAAPAPRARGGVVLVTNNFATGGAQSSARRLLVELASRGVHARAIVIEEQRAYPTPGRSALEAAGVAVDVAPRAGAVDPLATARAVAALVDRAAPDAVLFWNVIPEHKVLIADLLLGVPVWDVSPGEMYFASFARYFVRPRVGLPYLSLADYGQLLRGAVVKYASERARAEETLGTKVHVISNGVAVPARPTRRKETGRIVVGTLARIAPDKKLEQLIAAVRHKPFNLVIAGAPEQGSEAYAAALQQDSIGMPIEFTGAREPAEFLREIDIFAMISEPSGCPNASLEAMAAGLPIVATDHGGARDQIVDGESGILVGRGDSAALSVAVHELSTNVHERARLGDAAHARARACFDVGRMADDYMRVCGLRSCR